MGSYGGNISQEVGSERSKKRIRKWRYNTLHQRTMHKRGEEREREILDPFQDNVL